MANPNSNDRDDSVGAHPVGAPARQRPAWLFPLLGLLLLVLILLLLLSRCGGDDDSGSSATPTSTATAAATAPAASAPATSAPAATTEAVATTAGGDTAGGAGTMTADDEPLLPLADATKISADGDLSAYTGTDAEATAVAVQSVPADEGFWVGSSAADRVWIQLTGKAGESPFTVKKGDAVSFTGKVTKNASGFAKSAGVTDAEGKKLLTAQGQHITVAKSDLTLSK